jgi:hypothetical protein
MRQAARLFPIVFAAVAAAFPALHAAVGDEPGPVTIRLTDTRFKCKQPFLPSDDTGFEQCEVYTVPRFTASPRALLKVFGHCEVTIRYKTRDGLIERRDSLREKFHSAVVDGAGLAPVTMTFRPTGLLFDPIVEARATDLRCSIDQVFSY